MVVLSVAITTKTGKVLLSRQFVETSRMRLEGLLAAFPKLVSTEASAGKQHTFVETENVRYVYQPLEALYLVLITNKGSNIMEDLDTLRLLSKLIPDTLGMGVQTNEENISARAFDLLFAVDEVITAGGYREDVTLNAIRVNLEMESHEEKLAAMIKASRMAEAKETAKRRAAELREKAREDERQGRLGMTSPASRMTGISSSSAYEDRFRETGSYSRDREPAASAAASSATEAAAPRAGAKAGGMKLGAKKAAGAAVSGSLAGLMAEEGIRDKELLQEAAPTGGSAAAVVSAAAATAAAAVADQAVVSLKEDLAVRLTRDGGCESMEIKGLLSLTVNDPEVARMKVLLDRGDASSFSFQTHPHINKNLFTSDAVITLKAEDRGFPVGTPVGVVRWRSFVKDTDSSVVPLALTCWPEEVGGGVINVNLEYTLQNTDVALDDVVVTIPLGSEAAPKVASCTGSWKHNTRENVLTWHIDSISADNTTGSMEFNIKGRSVDAFFPVSINFSSQDILCPLAVKSIVTTEDGRPLRCTATSGLQVESFTIE